jgi:hypothetical protein
MVHRLIFGNIIRISIHTKISILSVRESTLYNDRFASERERGEQREESRETVRERSRERAADTERNSKTHFSFFNHHHHTTPLAEIWNIKDTAGIFL